jgi:hypothetical protein
MDNIRIRCPKCKWEPDGKAHWQCSCGIMWDTFSTGARCPNCGKIWDKTQCVIHSGGCDKWSPHLDWYDGLEDLVNKLKQEITEKWQLEKQGVNLAHTLSLKN